MAGPEIHFIQTQNLTQGTYSSSLENGSRVFVRVLEDLGGGKYQVSFGGNRFNVSSKNVLLPGQSFKAQILLQKEAVTLIPENRENLAAESTVKNTSLLEQELFSLGLGNDGITLKLLQFMQQSSLKIDKSIMNRAALLAKKFPGKEKKAAEIAALLLEKGIDGDEDTIQALLSLLDFEDRGDFSGNEGDKNNPAESTSFEQSFLARLFPEESSQNFKKNKPGLLTLVNQIKNGRHHWCFLPFTWQPDLMDSKNKDEFRGILRILIDSDLNQTEKIEISVKINLKKYDFVLYYNAGKVKEVRFCTLPPLLSQNISHEERRLGELLRSGMNLADSVPVTYSTSAFIEGLCAADEYPRGVNCQA